MGHAADFGDSPFEAGLVAREVIADQLAIPRALEVTWIRNLIVNGAHEMYLQKRRARGHHQEMFVRSVQGLQGMAIEQRSSTCRMPSCLTNAVH